jgi:hypothetical protein
VVVAVVAKAALVVKEGLDLLHKQVLVVDATQVVVMDRVVKLDLRLV